MHETLVFFSLFWNHAVGPKSATEVKMKNTDSKESYQNVTRRINKTAMAKSDSEEPLTQI